MATMRGDGMVENNHVAAASSRRALVAAGAGWVLGAAGFLLSAPAPEAEAFKGAKGGKKGKNHQDRDKHGDRSKSGSKNKKKKEARVRAESFKSVNITFVNGTSSADVQISRCGTQTQRTVAPGAQMSLSAPGSVQHPVATITAGSQSYVLYAQNPMIGLPWVKILDRTTDGLVFNEDLEEGEQATSDLFRLQRNADSAENKEFVLTLLRAPDSGAASASDTSVTTAESGNGGKGKKDHKKGGKGKNGNKGKKSGKDGNTSVSAAGFDRDIEITFVNATPATDIKISTYEWRSPTVVGPQQSHTFHVPSGVDGDVAEIRSPRAEYFVYSGNPPLALPWVKIRDDRSKVIVFDESLEQGEEVASDLFRVKRNPDSFDYIRFEVTLLRDQQ